MKIRRAVQTAGLTLAVVGLLPWSPVGADVRDAQVDLNGPAAPQAGEVVALNVTLPELTPVQRDVAAQIIHADPTLMTLLAGKSYSISGMGPWTMIKSPTTVLGAVVEIEVATPVVGTTASLPIMAYDESETTSPPYEINTRRVVIGSATNFSILVEYQRNAVLSIRPTGDSQFYSLDYVPNTNGGD